MCKKEEKPPFIDKKGKNTTQRKVVFERCFTEIENKRNAFSIYWHSIKGKKGSHKTSKKTKNTPFPNLEWCAMHIVFPSNIC